MRALSVQQPWAHLVVNGFLGALTRSWTTSFRGPVAIHASSAMPSKEIEREWTRDEDTAKVFAHMGWRGRNDLKALPRSAIVGVVQLRETYLGADLHRGEGDPETDWYVQDAIHRALGRKLLPFEAPRVQPVHLPLAEGEYAWILHGPVQIEPIDVMGQQHLWTVPADVSREVQARVTRTELRQWRPAAVDVGKRRRAMDDWVRHWSKAYDDEAWRLLIEAHWELKCEWFPFEEEVHEAAFRATLKKTIASRGKVVPGLGIHVHLLPSELDLFAGRPLVRALEYEATLRWEIQEAMRTATEDARVQRTHARLVELLKELKGKAAKKPMSAADIRMRVRAEFRRLMEEGVEKERAAIESEW